MKSKNLKISNWIPWMRRAIQLASLAEGNTSPNPLVGAVVLDSKGRLIGEGFHSKAGSAHAEVEAFAQAGSEAKGGTLIVTLEPCCHFGLTPPCTELILKSGISRVVIGLKDPDPRVSGKGISILRESGIHVLDGVLDQEIAYQNRAYIFRLKTGRPWGILKWAMSLDGRIALPNGRSKWISGEQARNKVHYLRSTCDAVIVGGQTIRSDDPLLTTRGLKKPEPKRVVFSSSLDLPQKAQVWETEIAETIIACSVKTQSRVISKLPKEPEKLFLKNSNPNELLLELAKKGCNRVLWECGPNLATSAIQSNCVQEVIVFISPKLLGGSAAMTPLADFGFNSMDEVFVLSKVSMAKAGKDFVLNMLLK